MVKSLEETIAVELKNFNFKRNSLGYEYLIDAIMIIIRDKEAMKNFYECIYAPVAEKYRTKPQNILWCINKILTLMYLNTDDEIIEDYFDLDSNKKPTVKEFILQVANKILSNEKNN